MAINKIKKIIIAETAPIISSGLLNTLKKIPGSKFQIIEMKDRESLMEIVSTEEIDILIASPAFCGILHPDDIRKKSLFEGIRIIAIEIGKLSPQTLALYDDHLHVTDDFQSLCHKILPSDTTDNESEEKESLSIREKEIVSLVVRGFTNQEIADKLFLSIHTVITHRRNIAKKLEIHSATGLTIYAIVNKIVDLNEIKI